MVKTGDLRCANNSNVLSNDTIDLLQCGPLSLGIYVNNSVLLKTENCQTFMPQVLKYSQVNKPTQTYHFLENTLELIFIYDRCNNSIHTNYQIIANLRCVYYYIFMTFNDLFYIL